MHLAVGPDASPVTPAQAVVAARVEQQTDIFLGMGAKPGQLGIADGRIGVELESLPGKDQCDETVEVEASAKSSGVAGLGRIVKVAG